MPQNPREIQTQLEQAQARLSERDNILNLLTELDGQLQALNQEGGKLEKLAIEEKTELNELRNQVLPIVTGWLNGEGTAKEQESAAEQQWLATEKALTTNIQTIELIKQERVALEAELLLYAWADDELHLAQQAKVSWLINNTGRKGNAIQKAFNEVRAVSTKQDAYNEAIRQSEHTLKIVNLVHHILRMEKYNNADDYYYSELADTEKILLAQSLATRFSISTLYQFAQVAVELDACINKLQDYMHRTGKWFQPVPKIDWEAGSEQVRIDLKETQSKMGQNLRRLQKIHTRRNRYLNKLKREFEGLIQPLWNTALSHDNS